VLSPVPDVGDVTVKKIRARAGVRRTSLEEREAESRDGVILPRQISEIQGKLREETVWLLPFSESHKHFASNVCPSNL